MTDLRKAAEMALEALENYKQGNSEPAKALRQALDKPEIDPQSLVEMAVLAEREACAKVCNLIAKEIDDTNGNATYCAKAIRARGEK